MDDDADPENKETNYYMLNGDTTLFGVTKEGHIQTLKTIIVAPEDDLSHTITVCVNNTIKYEMVDKTDDCRNITIIVQVCNIMI